MTTTRGAVPVEERLRPRRPATRSIRRVLAAPALVVAAASVALAPTAEASPATGTAAYCYQQVVNLQLGYSYCHGTVGTHRVAILCTGPFWSSWRYGPWMLSGQRSYANCGGIDLITQIFTQ
jgi:hypothetical protein